MAGAWTIQPPVSQRLKSAGKVRNYQGDMVRSRSAYWTTPPLPSARNARFAHCPDFIADCAGRAVAAVSARAALSRRPSGLDADGLALAQGRAGRAAMDRFQRDFALTAALGGRL